MILFIQENLWRLRLVHIPLLNSLMFLALLIFLISCSDSGGDKGDLVPVSRDQPSYVQEATLVEYLEVDSISELSRYCTGDVLCCTKAVGNLELYVYLEEKELVCKAHELDHKVYGPKHVGER